MNPHPNNQGNPVHQPETSFQGKLTVITDDPGLPLDSPEVIERERKRQEQLAANQRSRANGETSS